MKTLPSPHSLIGCFASRYLYSDVQIIGKVVGVVGKSSVRIQKYDAVNVTPKGALKFHVGGFSAVCENGYAQEWDFVPTDAYFTIRISKTLLRSVAFNETPQHYFDYNF